MRIVSPYQSIATDVLFRIDTGADISAIPSIVLMQLELEPSGEREIQDYDSRSAISECYEVQIQFGRRDFGKIEVISTESGSAFLGLDILNQIKLTLDGPTNLSSFINPTIHSSNNPHIHFFGLCEGHPESPIHNPKSELHRHFRPRFPRPVEIPIRSAQIRANDREDENHDADGNERHVLLFSLRREPYTNTVDA